MYIYGYMFGAIAAETVIDVAALENEISPAAAERVYSVVVFATVFKY